MKDSYETPRLTVHGTIEEMTQAFGSATAIDTIFYGGRAAFNGVGSQDGVVVPG